MNTHTSMFRGHWTASVVMAAAGLVGGMSAAQAATLQVSPVRLQFTPEQKAQVLHVGNNGEGALNAQIRVMRWTQEGGQDRLVPADEIVPSPAIIQVQSGQSQTVRIVRTQPVALKTEGSYRLLVDELPGGAAAGNTGLKVLMRYSIPVFIAPAPQAGAARKIAVPNPAKPVLSDLSGIRAQIVRGTDGKSELKVRNDGIRNLRISYLSLAGPNDVRESLGNGLFGYVLAGQEMSWPLSLSHPLPTAHTLKARFNDDREVRALPLVGSAQ